MTDNVENIEDVLKNPLKDLRNILNNPTDSEISEEIDYELNDCQYLTESEFLEYLSLYKISNHTHLKIISLNIANVLAKLNSLKLFVENISNEANKPNIIALSETHLNEKMNHGYSTIDIQNLLPGYKFFHEDRKNKKGGGVGFFIEENLAVNVEILHQGIFIDEIFEGLIIKVPNVHFSTGRKNLIILNVYRQPGDNYNKTFLESMNKCLEDIDKKSNELIVLGDMNLDLLKYQTHSMTSDYLDQMVAHGLMPGITRPTRIKHSSATLIDHIFYKNDNFGFGILATELAGSHGYTDHFPVFCTIKLHETDKQTKTKTTTIRYFTKNGNLQRQEALKKEKWEEVMKETDPNIAFETFLAIHNKHYSNSITTKTFHNNGNRLPKNAWMTAEILHKIRKRDRLAELKSRSLDYKKLRNEIVGDCRKAEKKYIDCKIKENIHNTKEHWKILKRIMGKTNNKSDLPLAFKHNDTWLKNVKDSATFMNKFYATVGPTTNQSVGKSNVSAENFMLKNSQKNKDSIATTNFIKEDVIEACKQLNAKKSCDAYGLSQAVVLSDGGILAPVLTHLANCSMNAGTFPENMKIARVIPIYKGKGEKYLFTNYRPISLLPVFSKILEKMIYSKLFDFLVRYQILFKSQYGFRKGRNTTHATVDFLQTVERALHDQEYAIGIFCDLSKAFDTLDHDILLKKLDHYGIRGKWHAWIKSYLSNRKQYVDMNGTLSNTEAITVGVPQGSILGPLLFLIYINDLPASLEQLIPVMFADDTNLIIKGKNLTELTSAINQDLKSLNDFFKANKLKLNVNKTKMVCFRKKGQNFEKEDLKIVLDEIPLDCEDQATFLGICLDSHLSWDTHCNNVALKMAKNSGILNRVKNYLPSSSLTILYNSLISSHFSYGLEVWGACKTKNLKRLQTIQKKSIRAITKAPWFSHSEPRMKNLKLLKIEDQYYLQCASLIFDMIKGFAPDVLSLLQEQNENSIKITRSARNRPQNLRLPAYNSIKLKNSFQNIVPDLWNTLPENLQSATTRKSFKVSLKKNMLDQYGDKTECSNPRCSDTRFHV